MSESPIGVPGWPLLAFSTASMDSVLMVLTTSSICFGLYSRAMRAATLPLFPGPQECPGRVVGGPQEAGAGLEGDGDRDLFQERAHASFVDECRQKRLRHDGREACGDAARDVH